MTDNQARGVLALALITLALVSCTPVQASNNSKPDSQTPTAQARARPDATGNVSGAASRSFGAQITAAVKAAEAQPHGDIGTAQVATTP